MTARPAVGVGVDLALAPLARHAGDLDALDGPPLSGIAK
jgi:hypothetical protein